jgi:TrmH RNA methyltransferase
MSRRPPSDRRAAPNGPRERPPHRHDPRPNRGASTEKLDVVFGLRAALAVFAKRPGDIVRVAYGRADHAEIGPLVDFAHAEHLSCDELGDREMEQLAQSTHHEGLIVVAAPRKWTPPQDLATALKASGGAAIALDRVRNPYNIGAMLRTAAFFGIEGALLGAPAPHPALPPDAVRVAEGGAESLLLSRTTDLVETLTRLRSAGLQIVGADGAADRSAIGFPFRRPTVLVMGNEREGLGDRVRGQCDAIVAIPGSGAVESLNVAVAAGVLISEIARR